MDAASVGLQVFTEFHRLLGVIQGDFKFFRRLGICTVKTYKTPRRPVGKFE